MAQSLFERFGGPPAVARLVFAFYDRVQRSDRLAPFFQQVDMRRLVEHQTKFVSQLMGGPLSYGDTELRQVHAHLDIDGRAFDEMMSVFEEALREFELPISDAETVLAAMRARRAVIVTSGQSARAPTVAPEPTGR